MARTSVTDHTTQGNVILERLGSTKLTPALKGAAASFKKAHGAYVAAGGAAETAKGARDQAIEALGAADQALDAAVETLAAKMAGAQMGTRKNPFASYSKYAPSDLVTLAYADEAKAVLALVAAVKKSKPSADVLKAAQSCDKLAAAVTKALAALTKPQLAYNQSLAARDALLLGWTKSLTVLKKTAQLAWIDAPATYKQVFAAPAKVQAPVKKRAKKTAKAAAAAPAPAPTNGVPAGTVAKPATTTTTSGN